MTKDRQDEDRRKVHDLDYFFNGNAERRRFNERRDKRPKLKLVGQDGNAFNILGLAKRDAKKAGWSKEKLDQFMKEAVSGNYDHLLQTCVKYFDVE